MMATKDDCIDITYCEKLETEQLIKMIKSLTQEIVEFNPEFSIFIEDQRKAAYDTMNNVVRYNILDSGAPCEYPMVTKEELLEELMVKIQDRTTRIHQSITVIKEKYDKLPKSNKLIEQQTDQIEWNPMRNLSIKGTVKYKAPSEYLEDIADILYQYDIAITCMLHYFDALDIKDNRTYQNLMNSFVISKELSEFVDEFKINSQALLL